MSSRASESVVLRDIVVAFLLAALLTAAWTLQNWSDLSALRLPDTDDAARLQQIRDWIAGQPFADLAQHRLGAPPGLEMHWSRLPDLVPGAIIVLLTPLFGAHAAELTAALLWPALLFAAALALVASIARALGASGPLAAVLAALAYPATTLFLPGRIDHSGLQLVLLLLLVRTLLGAGSLAAGIIGGLATAASLAVGFENAPLLALAGGVAVLLWLSDRPGAHPRLLGYGTALTLGLSLAGATLAASGWRYPACDGFTAELWRGAQLAALGPLLLAVLGFGRAGRGAKIAAAVAIGAAILAGVALVASDCLHPYGGVDPLLARLWLANVAEAQPLLAAPRVHAIGYAGLLLAGLLACAWRTWRTRDIGWLTLLAFQLATLAVTLLQLRGAYAGAMLAAPALAASIAAARARNPLALLGAWAMSAGLFYPMLGAAIAARPQPGQAPAVDCTTPQTLSHLTALPPGRLIAPVDLSAFTLAASHHRIVAGPYHRNNGGNLAMYRFFLGPLENSESIARQWGIDYVALCPDSFDETGDVARDPRNLAGALRAGRVPAWLRPISRPGEAPMLYALSAR